MKKRNCFLLGVAGAYALYQAYELNNFVCENHYVKVLNVNEPIRISVLADIHEKEYGRNNERLIAALKDIRPDVIAIPGDIICTKKYPRPLSYDKLIYVKKLMHQLGLIAPVLFSPGNHERRLNIYQKPSYDMLKEISYSRSDYISMQNERLIEEICGRCKM